jgi:hypothetical protein
MEGQTIQWSKDTKVIITGRKWKDRQYNAVLQFTACDYHFGIFWPLHCLSFHLRPVITTLVSFDHCIVCPSIYGLWLPLWYLQTFLFPTRFSSIYEYYKVLVYLSISIKKTKTMKWSKDTKVVITSVNWRTDNTMVKRYQSDNHKP